MTPLRLGIVGIGNIGSTHVAALRAGKIADARLAAVCDVNPARLAVHSDVPCFQSFEQMLATGNLDAVLVATPHFLHVPQAIAALHAGLHVLVEKPVSVHKAEVARLLAAHTDRRQVLAAMFNQRTDPRYRKLRDLVVCGELGRIQRISWTVTNWFRTDRYYATGDWRATWSGEGGGVLLNQSPHNLDLLQWIFGMPERVLARCHFGRHHQIEVEDDVTAILEYPSGATATFVTSTGEAPGVNRLEVAGTRGCVTVGENELRFTRNELASDEFSRTAATAFSAPPCWDVAIPTSGTGGQHVEILQNFVDSIARGATLIAPAAEGLGSVELANAMLMSAWLDECVTLPLDAERYKALLAERIATSHRRLPTAEPAADFANSFAR